MCSNPVPWIVEFAGDWKAVARTNDLIKQAVVYLYPSKAQANIAEECGGTAFLVTMKPQGFSKNFTYVVTNRHLVEKYGAKFIRINLRDKTKDHDVIRGDWIYHHPPGKPSERGDDLAACEFFQSIAEYEFVPIGLNAFVTRQLIDDLQIGIGEELYMVGRFANHGGTKRNLPTLRFGTIAMMPEEPIMDDKYPQETFLAEIHTVPGYSGSPVFVHVPADRLKRLHIFPSKEDADWAKKTGAIEKLLGIEWCRVRGDEKVMRFDDHEHTVIMPSGMSGVIPAWKIAELLDQSEFQVNREKLEKEPTKTQSESAAEHTGAPMKRKTRDVEIPPISRKQFFDDLTKATKKQS
jgi:Trypsin-like peptidase domain